MGMSLTVKEGTLAEERAGFPVKLGTNFKSHSFWRGVSPLLSSSDSRIDTSLVGRVLCGFSTSGDSQSELDQKSPSPPWHSLLFWVP